MRAPSFGDFLMGTGCSFIVFFSALFAGALIFGVGGDLTGAQHGDWQAKGTLVFAIGVLLLWWCSVFSESGGESGVVVFIVGLGLTVGGLFTCFGWILGIPVMIAGIQMMLEGERR